MKQKRIVWIVIILLLSFVMIVFLYNVISNAYIIEIIEAIENDDIEQCKSLLRVNVNLNTAPASRFVAIVSELTYETPLQSACAMGNVEIVRLLIEHGADVNYVKNGVAPFSPLMCAISNNDSNIDIVRLLIENDADVNYRINNNIDALRRIVEARFYCPNSVEMIDLLYENGADITFCYTNGNALNLACFWKNEDAIRHLITNYEFDINFISPIGRTCLIDYCVGVSNVNQSTVGFLLANGADKRIKDCKGKTAYDYALEGNLGSIVDLLSDA